MNKKIIVVSAVWCPSCLILKKHLKKLKEEYKIDIETLDYDLDEDRVNELNVKDILPVIIVKNNDTEISRLIGEKTYDEIIDFLSEASVI